MAKRNEIVFSVGTAMASEDLVVNFELPHAPTYLAPPAIPFQDAESQLR